MPYYIYTIIIWSMVYFLVGRRFLILWKSALIGVAVAWLSDYLGTRYNLYIFPKGVVYVGMLPLFHIVNLFASTMLFLNWLPRRWDKRMLYILYASVLFLFLEAVMHSAGAIVYPHWKLWYSYFLIIAGLSAVAYLSDLLDKSPLAGG